jgi:hypothetical protein
MIPTSEPKTQELGKKQSEHDESWPSVGKS